MRLKRVFQPYPQKTNCGKLVDNFCGKLKVWKKGRNNAFPTSEKI
jgi:hypothetical protein